MLTRQKVVLALLEAAGGSLTPTMLVKIAFLVGQETKLKYDRTFYDFVPYKYGPFSFALYRELDGLHRHGYVARNDNTITIGRRMESASRDKVGELSLGTRCAVAAIVNQYGKMGQSALLRDVYSRYPWYATKSELGHLLPKLLPEVSPAQNLVYTVGYEGKSVDSFFNDLLKAGIKAILDVRENAASRKYGFAKKSLSEIAAKLGLEYHHRPELGIPGKERVALNDYGAYQRLLNRYARQVLPQRLNHVYDLVAMLRKTPSVLLCVEKDVTCCHRGRLAQAAAILTGLPVVHL